MTRFRFAARIAAAIMTVTLATAACQPTTKTEGALSIPKLEAGYRQLPNGLKVYTMPDADTASVSVAVWYDVGSKDDPAGRSGFAHLFEHLMFKSTSNMPPEFFDRLTEDAGGFNNASTWNDFTNYYETVPANHLERVLWGEAERMGSLVVDEANFLSERDVVKEELRQSVLSQPYGKLFALYVQQANFDVHPYGRPGIGSIADLDASTLDDVRQFHAAYYRPDNAVLVVAGNFDQKQLDAWIDTYFAGIKSPDRPIPRVTAVEPARTAPKDITVYEPNVPLPAVMISWPAPAANSPDIAAWMIADAILQRGQSSRLHQSMVYEQQLAAEAKSNFEVTEHPGVYALTAVLSDGKTAEEGLASLKAEIAKMRNTLVTPEELDEARNELIVEALQGRETADGRAFELARSVILFKDPKASDAILAKLQTVTAEDVQRVSKAIMDDSHSVTIRYLPEELQQGATEALIADAPTIQATTLDIATPDIPVYTLTPEATRRTPPTAGAAIAGKVPTPSEKTLANGLRVIVASKPGLPLVSATLRIASGASSDPAGKAGLASLAADLTTRGTTTRSATDIAQQIERLGAAISAGAGADATDVDIAGRSDKAKDALAIMADVVMNPTFAAEELDRARSETLDMLMVALRQPSSIGGMVMPRVLYGAAPYGSVATPKTIEGLTREDIVALHASTWRPDQAILVIAGDITADEGFALAEDAFKGWTAPAAAAQPKPAPTSAIPDSASRAIVIDVPQIGQAAVMLGMIGPSRTDPAYFPTLVANDVLGGGYSARLNAEIRIKRGLSYGVRARLPSRMAPAPLVASAQTRNDAVPQVIDLMTTEFARLGAEPIPAAELEARKAVLIGSFGRDVETTGGLANQLVALAQFGLPLDGLSTYAASIAAVTADTAAAAAKTYYDPAKADIVVVGDASVFWNDVKAKRGKAERIEIDQLNLNSGTLK